MDRIARTARTALRLGAKTSTIVYRRGPEDNSCQGRVDVLPLDAKVIGFANHTSRDIIESVADHAARLAAADAAEAGPAARSSAPASSCADDWAAVSALTVAW